MQRVAQWRPPFWLWVLSMVLMLTFGIGLSYVRGQEDKSGNCTESADVCRRFAEFWTVWNLAEARFVDPKAVQSDEMIAGAINGMLDSLGDQGHTRYLTAEQVQRFQESLRGSFEGIGAYVDVEGGLPIITAPIEGSPAEAAGVLPGDIIVKINGVSTEGVVLEEVINQIRGEPGTQVILTVRHQGEEGTADLTITRAAVTIPSTAFTMLPNNIAYIRLTQFSQKAGEAVQGRLDEAKAAGARAIIFDVRDNPGGLLTEAVNVTSVFVPKGDIVLREANRDGSETTYRSKAEQPQLDLPMVVLINSSSASSAEIFAGTLQDYGRATVIGVPTAGTGTVLSTFSVGEGQQKASVLLGTAQWLTPKGRYLRREGVAPDLTVGLPLNVRQLTPNRAKTLSPAEISQTADEQLSRAMRLLSAGGNRSLELSRFSAR